MKIAFSSICGEKDLPGRQLAKFSPGRQALTAAFVFKASIRLQPGGSETESLCTKNAASSEFPRRRSHQASTYNIRHKVHPQTPPRWSEKEDSWIQYRTGPDGNLPPASASYESFPRFQSVDHPGKYLAWSCRRTRATEKAGHSASTDLVSFILILSHCNWFCYVTIEEYPV